MLPHEKKNYDKTFKNMYVKKIVTNPAPYENSVVNGALRNQPQ